MGATLPELTAISSPAAMRHSWLNLPVNADSDSRSGRSWSLLRCAPSCSPSPYGPFVS